MIRLKKVGGFTLGVIAMVITFPIWVTKLYFELGNYVWENMKTGFKGE